jgi:hypothetical protein
MDLTLIGWECGARIHVAQDGDHLRAVVHTVMNLWVP